MLPAIFAERRLWIFARLIGLGALQAGATIATVLLIRHAFDTYVIQHRKPFTEIVPAAGALIGLALLAALLRKWEQTTAEQFGQDYILRVRIEMFAQLSSIAPRASALRNRGGLLLRFVGDLTAIRQWLSLGLARLAVASVICVGTLVALMALTGQLALLVVAAIFIGGAISASLGRPLEAAVRQTRKQRARLTANVNEKVASIAVVQAHGQIRREQRRFRRNSEQLRDAMLSRARWVGYLRATTEATTRIATAAVLLLGAWQVSRGKITPGSVVAAMSVVGLLMPQLRGLGRVYEIWNAASVSLQRLEDFFAIPDLVREAPDATALQRGAGAIVFDDIAIDPAFEHFSATADAGSVVAIVGPNGAGKSTLIWLAARLMDPDRGRILIDGQDIKAVTLESLRRAIGIVGPDLPLLRGSLRRNLNYRHPDASDDAIAAVCTLCGLDELIQALPRGLDTRLTEQGANMSLGQRQRIALARALLGEPRLLLLDEADSNLDPQSNAALLRVIASYRGTVLMVTHEAEWLGVATDVWHIDDGVLVERGAPVRVLAVDGPTARLFGRRQAAAS
jgi:ABC-type multidrug transport system fused ATPase/permease subunit